MEFEEFLVFVHDALFANILLEFFFMYVSHKFAVGGINTSRRKGQMRDPVQNLKGSLDIFFIGFR